MAHVHDNGIGVRIAGYAEDTFSDGDDDSYTLVAHQYDTEGEPCEGCGELRRGSFVRLEISDLEGRVALALFDVEQALLLAELLRTVAGWVIEERAETPDIQRESSGLIGEVEREHV